MNELAIADNCLRISGELQSNSVPSLLRQGEAIISQHAELTIDLQAVTNSDSSGLALLLAWQRFANSREYKLHFVNLPEQLLNNARVSGVADLLNGNS